MYCYLQPVKFLEKNTYSPSLVFCIFFNDDGARANLHARTILSGTCCVRHGIQHFVCLFWRKGDIVFMKLWLKFSGVLGIVLNDQHHIKKMVICQNGSKKNYFFGRCSLSPWSFCFGTKYFGVYLFKWISKFCFSDVVVACHEIFIWEQFFFNRVLEAFILNSILLAKIRNLLLSRWCLAFSFIHSLLLIHWHLLQIVMLYPLGFPRILSRSRLCKLYVSLVMLLFLSINTLSLVAFLIYQVHKSSVILFLSS